MIIVPDIDATVGAIHETFRALQVLELAAVGEVKARAAAALGVWIVFVRRAAEAAGTARRSRARVDALESVGRVQPAAVERAKLDALALRLGAVAAAFDAAYRQLLTAFAASARDTRCTYPRPAVQSWTGTA